ncbi:MAG: flavoprotein, partial [Gemmatimonadota bacterium]
FSPWEMCLDPAAAEMLRARGWEAPPGDELPTGNELVERYLEPLARHPDLRGAIRYGHRVTGVTRLGRDRLKGASDRGDAPFVVRYETEEGPGRLRARAVLDASGTWNRPRPLGAGGLPARGEREAEGRLEYGLPDVRGADRDRYAGRRTAVVGGGHSAANVLLDLVRLGEEAAGTESLWVLRGGRPGRVFRDDEDEEDELEARGALERRLRELVEAGRVRMVTGFATRAVESREGAVALRAEDGRTLEVDRV